jgi:hypothetical protein
MYYGAGSVNVYVGGYSGWVRDPANANRNFSDYLENEAPYRTERELREYLTRRGITISSTKVSSTQEVLNRQNVTDLLFEGYEIQEKGLLQRDRKAQILKEHEGAQIYLLERDIAAEKRSIFVTADVKLRRAVTASRLASVRDALISPQNLIQLVDLIIGIDVPPASLARLLWSVNMADDRAVIKDYLVRRALPHYDAALLLKLGDTLDSYTDRILREAKLENVKIAPAGFEEKLTTSRFMDRVEDEVFSSLASEVQKLKRTMKDAGLN